MRPCSSSISCSILCMLYKIRCNLMHILYCALYLSRMCLFGYKWRCNRTRGAPRWRTLLYRMIFILLSVSLWNDVGDPVFDGVGLAGFKNRANAFSLAWLLVPFLSPAVFFFLFFNSVGWCCGAGVFRLIWC